MRIAHRFLIGSVLAVAIALLDQISKWQILAIIPLPDRPDVEITSFFNLALVWNHGISFGMFAGHNRPFVLIGVSVVIIGILLIWLYKNTSLLMACALGCVIGGASGNVIDRVRFGAVIDFIDVHIGPYHWPAFNIADSVIFIGVVLLCVSGMFVERRNNVDH